MLCSELRNFLLRQFLEGSVFLHLLDIVQSLDSAADGFVVGQHSAQPSLIDIILSASGSLVKDRVLRLLLCSHKENRLAGFGNVLHERIRFLNFLHRLLQIDNVDSISLCEDVRSHLRIPSPGLMSEMNTGFQ